MCEPCHPRGAGAPGLVSCRPVSYKYSAIIFYVCHDFKKSAKHRLRLGNGINESCSYLPVGFRKLFFSCPHVQCTQSSHSKGQSWPWTSDLATCWWPLGWPVKRKSLAQHSVTSFGPSTLCPREGVVYRVPGYVGLLIRLGASRSTDVLVTASLLASSLSRCYWSSGPECPAI